jgi:hypothetical protein
MSDKLPAVTSPVPRDLRNFLDRVRDVLKTTGVDGLVTVRQLAQLNLVRVDAQGNLRVVTDAGGALPPPPAPTNVVANAAIQNIIVEWDRPNYRGHAYAEVWGAGVDDFSLAVLIGSAPGGIYVDSVGPSITRYYWIRFVNEDDVRGPFNSISGTVATTGPDVEYILGLLSGRITSSELATSLTERINLIDGPDSLAGSVNARLAVVQGQVNDLLNIPAWDDTITYIQGEQVTFAGGLYIALQGSTNVSPNDTDFWQRIGDYTTLGDAVAAQAVQISQLDDGLGAAVTQTNALATQLRGTYDGTDLSLVTSGLIFQERQARNTADSALASDITTLTAFTNTRTRTFYQNTPPTATTLVVGDNWVDTRASYAPEYAAQDYSVSLNRIYRWTGTEWVEAPDSAFADSFAAIEIERVARATADEAFATQITTLQTNVDGNTAAIQQEVIARTTADQALASDITTLQVSVGENTAAIQQEATVRAQETGELFAQYTVKIDTNGYVSGFGLASTANNSTPFSEFVIRADSFSVASPSGPGITPIVPFVVNTTQQTINGVTVPPGVYMDAAFIKNGTITNAKIGNAAIDDAKIANLSASKITAGSVAVGEFVASSNYVGGIQGWRIDGNGTAEFSNAVVRGTVFATDGRFVGEIIAEGAGGNRARMFSGDFEVYKQVPNVGQVLYKAISRVETGVATNDVVVTIPGYFVNQPRVLVSPANIQFYNAAFANQSQSVQCEARNIEQTAVGSMVWRFRPVATLSLAANTGQTVVNEASGTISTGWLSSQYVTPANTQNITPSVTLASNRGTGSSGVFYRRSVRWRVQYFSGGVWVNGPFTTVALSDSVNASVVSTATFTFPSVGTWTFRIETEAFDTDGTTFGSAEFETTTDSISRTGAVTVSVGVNESATRSLNYTPSYTLPSGWTLVSVTYNYNYNYAIEYFGTNPPNASITGSGLFLVSGSGTSLTRTHTTSSNSLTFSVTAGFIDFSRASSASLTLNSATGTVTRTRPLTNSTTANNSFSFNAYDFTLSAAQVLATGTLNWIAIGE